MQTHNKLEFATEWHAKQVHSMIGNQNADVSPKGDWIVEDDRAGRTPIESPR